METPFSIGESLRFGWQQTRANSGLMLGTVLIMAVLEIVHYFLQTRIPNEVVMVCINVLITLVEVVVGIGMTVIALKLARRQPAAWSDLIPPWKLAVRYVLASLIAGLISICGFIPTMIGVALLLLWHTMVGFVLAWVLIVIGVSTGAYLLVRYSMTKLAAIEEATAMTAVHRSAQLTRNVKGRLIALFAILFVLNIVGAIALLVGLLIAIPVTTIAFARVYVVLCERAEASPALSQSV